MTTSNALWLRILMFATALAVCAQDYVQPPPPAPVRKPPERLVIPEPIPAIRPAPATRIRWVNSPSTQPDVPPLLEIATKLAGRQLRGLEPRSWEEQILSVGKQLFDKVRVNLGTVTGVETLATPDGDVLVAKWESSGRNADGESGPVWLWDSPIKTVAFLEVSPAIISNRDRLASYVDDLFLWHNYSLRSIAMFPLAANRSSFGGIFELSSDFPGTFQKRFYTLASGKTTYAVISMSKPMLHYPEGGKLKERFPPLRDRLKNLSRSDLLLELGRDFPQPYASSTYPAERDTVVLRELAERGQISNGDIWNYAGAPDEMGVRFRRVSLLQLVLQNQQHLPQYLEAMTTLLLSIELPTYALNSRAAVFLGAAQKQGLDASQVALNLIRAQRAVEASLRYFEQVGVTDETRRKLLSIPVAAQFDKLKQAALSSTATVK